MNVDERMGRDLRPVQALRCLIRKKMKVVTEKSNPEISPLFVPQFVVVGQVGGKSKQYIIRNFCSTFMGAK
jgi:hypothetical protein